jgi:hypothetical protein
MTTVHLDPSMTEAQRRSCLYGGDLVLLSPRPSTLALCDHARGFLEQAFAPHHPQQAQFHLPVEEFVARFAPVKPAFIHDARTKDLVRAVVTDLACDEDQTYVDVPRLRGVTSDGYLTSGVGFAHHPHRDSWWSAPLAQLNWWMPIYEFTSDSGMAFHPLYFSRPITNGSAEFSYYEWNSVGRKDAAKHITSDTRKQPKAEEPLDLLEPDIRPVVPVGGVILFAAANLHSTVPNTSGVTRYSIDFRTVDLGDVAAVSGVPNVDSAPLGTSLRDFVRCRDGAAMPEEVVALHDQGADPSEGALVFTPDA